MSTPNEIAELLRKGIEAARGDKKSEARGYFERVVELDEKNEKGWFWLASVVESDEERRICLSNVLHINPNNERAKRALNALQAKIKDQKSTNSEDVIAGVSRRRMTLIIGFGAITVIVILIIALTVIVGNTNREAAERSTQAAVALVATDTAQTATALVAEVTETAVAALATQQALVTPITPTRALATLPPTWTPTPQATVPATRDALPEPAGLTGRLAVWGGQDLLSVGYLPLGYYDFALGNQYTQIGDSLGKEISFALNGERVAYTVYDQLLFGSSLEAMNLNGTQRESLPDRWRGQNIFQPQMPHYGGPSKQYIVFVARTQERQTTQVFMLNLNPPEGLDPLKQLTDDDTIYTEPVLSPDGKKVVAVRADPNNANPSIDLINIDVATGAKIPVTNDGQSYAESSPFFTRDGSQVVFAAIPSNAPDNGDLYIKNSDGNGSTLPFYRGDGNDTHPVLSPDGHYVAFASNLSGSYDIFVYDRTTSVLYQLTNSTTDEYPGDWWQP